MLQAHGLSHRGVKREKNEDSIFCDTDAGLFIVADGMGGHAKGEVASSTATNVISSVILAVLQKADKKMLSDDSFVSGIIKDSITQANTEIYNISRNMLGGNIIGTTATLVLFIDDKVYIGHVGDSRVYRLRKGALEKLTTDHSKAQELIDAGLLKEEDAENHRSSHVLTRAVGSVDYISPDTASHEVKKGDIFLLTTDGMFRVLNAENVKEILLNADSPEEKCNILLNKTLEGGAPDNTSLIIVEQQNRSFVGRLLGKYIS